MKMYKFKPDAKDQIDHAGVKQIDLARKASYDRHELNKKIARGGNIRPSTANSVAATFAVLANEKRIQRGEAATWSQETALTTLFEEFER